MSLRFSHLQSLRLLEPLSFAWQCSPLRMGALAVFLTSQGIDVCQLTWKGPFCEMYLILSVLLNGLKHSFSLHLFPSRSHPIFFFFKSRPPSRAAASPIFCDFKRVLCCNLKDNSFLFPTFNVFPFFFFWKQYTCVINKQFSMLRNLGTWQMFWGYEISGKAAHYKK